MVDDPVGRGLAGGEQHGQRGWSGWLRGWINTGSTRAGGGSPHLRPGPHRYRNTRWGHRAEARKTSQAKQSRAAEIAARIVAAHGNTLTIEDCRISTWAKLWGKRTALFNPGMLVSALETECAATGGQLYRAATRSTALSQHCLCGQRAAKTLDQRTHHCKHCGLHSDRDVVSATLAACVDLTDPADPRTARVDHELAHGLHPSKSGVAQSIGTSHQHHRVPDRPGPAAVIAVR
ncbi:MAG TPA: zinc ribbon domain-containing protein [Mycobacterium sp.]|nr:zinc ribbon domain-containing protein [Mycobacterium sp.]HUH68564.1 zinc ribbon domain-containing protein [Mycobacterium sp.]